jgi:5'-nucleotidase
MTIFLTNDDGIDSDGIQKLIDILRNKKKYKVFVIAPDKNRSGISHAISLLNEPVKISSLGENIWSCSGYPADCIIVGLKGILPEKPDLVLSGINRGANLGTDILYSGTAAAARQASLCGIPAIALSLTGSEPYNWDMAVSWTAEHLEELTAFWEEEAFVNVNIPNSSGFPEGLLQTWPAIKKYQDIMSTINAPDGKQWCFLEAAEEIVVSQAGSDCYTVSRNFVSVSSVYNYPTAKQTVLKPPLLKEE